MGHAASLIRIIKQGYVAIKNDLINFKEQFLDMRSTKYLKTIISDILSLHFKNVQNLMIVKYHLENFNNNDVVSIFSQVETKLEANPLKKMLHKENLGIGKAVNLGFTQPVNPTNALIQDPLKGTFSLSNQFTNPTLINQPNPQLLGQHNPQLYSQQYGLSRGGSFFTLQKGGDGGFLDFLAILKKH